MADRSIMAFSRLGDTVQITAAVSPPTGVQAMTEATDRYPQGQYYIVNTSDVVVYLGVGGTASAAASQATNTGRRIPLLPSSAQVLRFNSDSYFSAAVDSGTQAIQIIPGEGL